MKRLLVDGLVAQRLEQRTHNPLVVGSNPTGPTNFSAPRPYEIPDGHESLKPAREAGRRCKSIMRTLLE